MDYQRVLIPVHIGANSQEVAREGLEIARNLGAKACFLFVKDSTLRHYLSLAGYPSASPGRGEEEVEQAMNVMGWRVLEDDLALARRLGVEAEAQLLGGNPLAAILAEIRPGDLIVVGSHERGSLGHPNLGSVARGLVEKAPIPVLTVRLGRPVALA
ncbi:Universal stress protein family protein [Calidithermus terrae]|uniref:Universal stress protein family protein n=1 Tax=Calidithermus terrae TaxID=1408545 RepID=A0A399F2L2_9DEIN|nr:universal stress protein [Calidithermus terrae]RIH90323.1 Universal stress protein family protein [Calidithermus terrae]